MTAHTATERVSTGFEGLDAVVDGLRIGDNVVWQVDDVADYRTVARAFAARAVADGRRVVYVRFGGHARLIDDVPGVVTVEITPDQGFEGVALTVHELVTREGTGVFYVFDSLTELLPLWFSDLMIANFFAVTCPYLFRLDTVAYFALERGTHTPRTVARIRETTQVLLDLYRVDDEVYVHPLKAWRRYSPTMFFPHRVRGDQAQPVTSSVEVARLFSRVPRQGDRADPWHVAFDRARDALDLPTREQLPVAAELVRMLLGGSERMVRLAERYVSLAELLLVGARTLGTGRIGGKSAGMLVARAVIEHHGDPEVLASLEPHDSFYVGSDVFYTYLVENGWWLLRAEQRTAGGYYARAAELRERVQHGQFPAEVREQFVEMLEYFGQSPVIVRSSSLLEDDFGNAFAGKYDSVFCVNQGDPAERLAAFEDAVRTVYASAFSEEALRYRAARGLHEHDEQMAVLVQRVSGDRHGDAFFPHAAGVAVSQNLYLWDPSIDAGAGMMRVVLGLGTRAVDRTSADYARIVCLDDPTRLPPTAYGDAARFAQRRVDLLSLSENEWTSRRCSEVLPTLGTDAALLAGPDVAGERLAADEGRPTALPHLVDLHGLLTRTELPATVRRTLDLLEQAYEHPVDVEFTVNLAPDATVRINVVQCRPLQTRGPGSPVVMPRADAATRLLQATGGFMGGNVRIPVERVVLVRPDAYLALPEQGKHAVARAVGRLNRVVASEHSTLLIGPGRWGTTTPALGVPARFSELSRVAALVEVAAPEAGIDPELSYGSHFFQDLVEQGIFYVALHDGRRGAQISPERVTELENLLAQVLPDDAPLGPALHVAAPRGWWLASDIASQAVVCGPA
ncbi:pyruvate kinase [Cellulomonas sp. APG4]|uniref:PEP/pyruvate-binding domain-containing protein n=1 Tax=Cellulomonas sp. APG4 TaxID=1538656 RepID=UPI0013795560|nr:PEP/pyruvate-binding domain-containing protein [Cellulomonas sp. APG4]NCT90737.1 pyruvate kinase [Cellulomonas sp. APG4]